MLAAGAAILVAGPTALAFFSGGYFAPARAGAGLGAFALVAAGLLAGAPAPRGRAVWLAIGAFAGLAGWTLLSLLWAPVAGNAYSSGQIAVLYLGALLAGVLLLRSSAAQRWTVPGLAAGTVIVVGYGLAGRLLPGVLHLARSVSAEGRLEQPLTYWNAMGELAAIGFVLCAGLAGGEERPRWVRGGAAAGAAVLGLGLYVSFSRGALFACAAGVVALVVAARSRQMLIAAAISLLAGAVASAAAARSGGVTSLAGTLAAREREGAITLAVLVLVAAAAALAQRLAATRGPRGRLQLPRHAPVIATVAVCAGLVAAILAGARETSGSAVLSGGANRLVSLQSNRYAYWDVALRAFATAPVAGVGAGGWEVYWLRWRTVSEFAANAHSLELETLAELGLVGVALLLAFFSGVALAARRALAASRDTAIAVAGLVACLAHSPLDWDWQMPALTLVAVILAGLVLARAAGVTAPRRSAALRD